MAQLTTRPSWTLEGHRLRGKVNNRANLSYMRRCFVSFSLDGGDSAGRHRGIPAPQQPLLLRRPAPWDRRWRGAAGSQSPPTVSCNCAEPIAPVHRAWVLSEPLLDIGIVPQ
jgi:hypothetical protein